jgi:hypothetical protein
MELTLDPAAYAKAKAAFDREHAPFIDALQRREQALLPMLDSLVKGVDANAWEYVEVKQAKSKDGATLTVQDDGSILASGKNPKFDVYTITAKTKMTNINAIRLEALAHPSMVKGGPGRAANGNFALSDFSAVLTSELGDSPPRKLQFKNARATFEQKGLPIKAAIDADPKSAWAIDPQFGKDHAATFELDAPAGFEGGSLLTITLKFNNNDGHNIGRPRISITNASATPTLTASGVSAQLRDV